MINFILGVLVGLVLSVVYPGLAFTLHAKARDLWNRLFGPKDPPPTP